MLGAVPALERRRLISVLNLLASDQTGEAAAAAHAATAAVKRLGLTWDGLLTPKPAPAPPACERCRGQADVGFERMVVALLQQPGGMTAWERGFISDVQWLSRPSSKQYEKVAMIYRRVTGRRAP